MTETSAPSPAAVLDYAPPKRQDPGLRWLRAIALVFFCMLLFGGGGYAFQPVTYRATGIISVAPPTWTHPRDDAKEQANVQAAQGAQMTAVAALTSTANVNAAVATLVGEGISITPQEISERIRVAPVAESRLVYVRFDDQNPINAAAVVDAVMTSYTAPGASVVSAAGTPTRPQRNVLYPIAGLAMGLLLALFIVARRWK